MQPIIGIDFDNTIVSYDDLIHRVAVERGLVGSRVKKNKKKIRDAIRQLPGGEIEWQKVQAVVYGPRMAEAFPAQGAVEFLQTCEQRNVQVWIVSHKTEFANYDDSGTSLRAAALSWLQQQRATNGDVAGLSTASVFFESTRREKLHRILKLGCTHFIDDLEETFLEASFPAQVEQILYAPHGAESVGPKVAFAGDWRQIADYFFMQQADTAALASASYFASLLGSPIAALEPIHGGRNSRVYSLTTEDGNRYAAKIYSGATADGRSRMSAEFTSFTFLHNQGVNCVPKPIVADESQGDENGGCAVYEFVDGRRLTPGEVSQTDIDQAAQFLIQLGGIKKAPAASQLPTATEACFSVQDITRSIETRLERLLALDPEYSQFKALDTYLHQEFLPAFQEIRSWCRKKLEAQGTPEHWELETANRTLSPSDFGFHNALKQEDGRLVFLDFEYFGWDDPAKMVSDFLLHPAMTLSSSLKIRFLEGVLQGMDSDQGLRARIETVYPLFGLKWCLILLNEFLPESLNRRRHSSGADLDQAELQQRQLEKSRQMLQQVRISYERFPYWEKTNE